MRMLVWFVLIGNVVMAAAQVAALAITDGSTPPFVPLLFVAAHLILALMMRDVLEARRIC